MNDITISEIWTYPIKSVQGLPRSAAELGAIGIEGDRVWAVRDLERGGLRGAKKIPGLMQLRAHLSEDGQVRVQFPDGSEGVAGDADLDQQLSAWLDRKVRLERLPAADDLDHFRRGAPDHSDPLTELRAIFGREPDEPLPDLNVFPPEVAEFESPPGAHYDCYPLLIMSTAAFADLAEILGPDAADIRRFRPSVVVDVPGAHGHPEFAWTSRRARLGEAEIEFLDPCPRCVMITHGIDDAAPGNRAVLRHVVRTLDQNLGIYARIVRPGRIAVGDRLLWVDEAVD